MLEPVEFSPGVVAVLLPDVVGNAYKKINKIKKIKEKELNNSVLVDSGASAKSIRAQLGNQQKKEEKEVKIPGDVGDHKSLLRHNGNCRSQIPNTGI